MRKSFFNPQNYFFNIYAFALRSVLVELTTTANQRKSCTSSVRMDPSEIPHFLSHPMVPYGQQVSKNKLHNDHHFCTVQYVRFQRMHFILFILFSFLIDFLRKCAQMSLRHESPAPLCARLHIFCGRVHSLHRSEQVG